MAPISKSSDPALNGSADAGIEAAGDGRGKSPLARPRQTLFHLVCLQRGGDSVKALALTP